MTFPRHLLLYGAIAATLSATAQEILERRELRTIDVREENGSSTVTLVTSTGDATETEVLTGEEAVAWIAEHNEDGRNDGELLACTMPHNAETVMGIPALCQVIVHVGKEDGADQGSAKAEVFRYRYKQKTTTAPVHTVSDNTYTEVGAEDGVDKSVVQEEARLVPDDLRVLPNPSAGLFTLAFPLPTEGGNGELYITDAVGRVVHRETVMGSGGQARTIDMTGRGKGTYIATVVVGDRTISKRLVIE